jgi:hypothetical protein
MNPIAQTDLALAALSGPEASGTAEAGGGGGGRGSGSV